MNEDRSFEDDLRRMLDEQAGPGAPERLVERVARVPESAPAPGFGLPRRPSIWRFGVGLAAAAAGLAIVAVALGLLRGSSGVGGQSPSPSAPVAVVSPSSPASNPSLSAGPTTSAVPSATPSSSASPTTSPSGPIPSDFQPVSVTFVSANEGWVLGGVPCASGQCPFIVRTLDGGQTWTPVAAPATTITSGSPVPAGYVDVTGGVDGIRFADPLDGWVFGPELWSTHDGGMTWQRVTLPGASGAAIVALEARAGSVQAAVYDPATEFVVATSPVISDQWTIGGVTTSMGAGPVPQAGLVLAGRSGWMLVVNRTVVGGLSLGSTGWVSWQPPCQGVNGPALLAASDNLHLVAACDEGVWGPGPGATTYAPEEHLYSSTNGGTSFTRSSAALPYSGVSAIASPTSSVIALAGSQGSGTVVGVSTDGGQSWTTTLQLGTAHVDYLGFTTSSQGVLIADTGMWMTRDGGHTWSQVSF
jgi:photosystem II stability/assembly factor-like uncharacterized protein